MCAGIMQMRADTFRIEDGGVRFFLLTGTERALLIDSGMTVQNAKEIAESLTTLPVSLLNTHADRDHIGSNASFASCYMHPAEEPNYRRSGGKNEIVPVEDGGVLDLGGRELEIVHLPGHTPGSIAVLDRKNRVLISGDPIQENGRIFLFGQFRDLNRYVESLEQLSKRIAEFDEIWPSHADLPVAPDRIFDLIAGTKRVLAGAVSGTPETVHGTEITAYDIGCTVLLCDR